MWFTDVGRFQASNYHVLQLIFEHYFVTLKEQRTNPAQDKIKIVFVVRDSNFVSEEQRKDTENTILNDAQRLFQNFKADQKLEDHFTVIVKFMANRVYDY